MKKGNNNEEGSNDSICNMIMNNTSLTCLFISQKFFSNKTKTFHDIFQKKKIKDNFGHRLDKIVNSMKKNSKIIDLKIGFFLFVDSFLFPTQDTVFFLVVDKREIYEPRIENRNKQFAERMVFMKKT